MQNTAQGGEKITFSFGRNWQDFVQKHYSEDRLAIAKRHLLEFLGMEDLKGKYFLDIGCGSGIHSLAALESGAERVVSFDLDPYSVETTKQIRAMRGDPKNWTVTHGSVLDSAFLSTLEPADVAYSWGVLHHTGQMWQAIRNASALVRPNGMFYIALYLTSRRSNYWIKTKQRYNRASGLEKKWMEAWYIFREVLIHKTFRGYNPISYISDYKVHRGMDFMTDVRDWLGGYPYEDVTVAQMVQFAHRELNMNMINLSGESGLAEFLLERRR